MSSTAVCGKEFTIAINCRFGTQNTPYKSSLWGQNFSQLYPSFPSIPGIDFAIHAIKQAFPGACTRKRSHYKQQLMRRAADWAVACTAVSILTLTHSLMGRLVVIFKQHEKLGIWPGCRSPVLICASATQMSQCCLVVLSNAGAPDMGASSLTNLW